MALQAGAEDPGDIVRLQVEKLEVVKVSSLASNKKNFYQFMRALLCHLSLLKPNILVKFRLADVSKPHFVSSPLLLRLST